MRTLISTVVLLAAHLGGLRGGARERGATPPAGAGAETVRLPEGAGSST